MDRTEMIQVIREIGMVQAPEREKTAAYLAEMARRGEGVTVESQTQIAAQEVPHE